MFPGFGGHVSKLITVTYFKGDVLRFFCDRCGVTCDESGGSQKEKRQGENEITRDWTISSHAAETLCQP